MHTARTCWWEFYRPWYNQNVGENLEANSGWFGEAFENIPACYLTDCSQKLSEGLAACC